MIYSPAVTRHDLRSSSSRQPKLRLAVACMLLLPAAACGDAIDPGELETLALQPQDRFAVGSTYYLPTPAQSRWVLVEAPADNDNRVIEGGDGYARFTPVVPGDYAFVIEGTEQRRSFTAVAQTPYEQLNYYATSSMVMVDGELWVANLFDPHISRVDPDRGQVLGTIQVGPWPSAVAYTPGQDLVLVAHKAGDTVGFVDVESQRLVDALWVGDEPAEIMLSPDGGTAYVSLATEEAVVAVDVARREVIGRVSTNVNPTTMALSSDGSTLFVASYRSGVSNRQQYGTEPRNDSFDIAVVDTASLEVRDYIGDAGATIGGLLLTDDRLYVATTRVAVEELTTEEGMTAFRHTVAAYDPSSLTELGAVDLGRQDTAAGLAVRPFGMALAGGTLWVTAEGSDLVVGLDPQTLAETARFDAPGRPRTVLADGDRLFVHGAQAYQVTIASSDGTVGASAMLSGDPRPAGVAAGQELYTGTGARGGINHGCADCHVDGLTDGNLWRAGFASSASRPMFWLEGTAPIGWEGDADDLYSYLFGSPGPTIGATLTDDSHQALFDYLAALVPPPPANGWTQRDGSPTEVALRGQELFEGKGACAGCHAGPLKTEGLRLPGGGTQDDHPIVVPSLVGAYRHTFWLVDGAARSLREAVVAMLPLSGATLDDGEIDDVARYLQELTARELFVLASAPAAGELHARSEGPLTVTLSHPAFDDPDNLALVQLRAAGGDPVEATVQVDGRHLSITPAAALSPGGAYELVLAAGFEAFNELALEVDETIAFTVAEAPALRLEGEYTITVEHPTLDPVAGAYDGSVTFPVRVQMIATPSGYGAQLVSPITDDFAPRYDVVVDGDVAYFPPFAFPVGPPGFYNRSFPTEITLVDGDGDGAADSGQSTLYLRSPGLEATDVRWTLARDEGGPADCVGQQGTHELDLMTDAAGSPTIDWSADVQALGYYVTDPDAVAPAGPGPVTGGETYWAISTAEFPTGFAGPVVYRELPEGAMDVSADSGAPEGGAALPAASCVKLTVVFNDFTTTELRYPTPEG